MFSKSFILGALTAFLSSANAKDAEMVMRYKIAQVTDLHFGESETADKLTAGYLLSMLTAEQPSLVVITGDIGSGSFEPFHESYKKLEGVFDLGMANGYTGQFAWIPGASDFEGFVNSQSAYEQFKYSAGLSKWDISKNNQFKWEAAKLFHPFTYNIPIKYKDDVALTLYLFGTGRYDCMGMGGNDCIRRDAIEWYREESNKLPLDNKFRKNGIAFMHYPLQEHMQMVDSQPVHGQRRDYVGCQAINTGLFSEIVSLDTIQAVFAGSDHSSDFWGEYNGKILGYGRKTGFGSYGPKFQLHGIRIIDAQIMDDGSMKIDTWIRQEDSTVDRQDVLSGPSKFTWLKKGHCMGAEEKVDLASGILNIDGSQTSSEWQKELKEVVINQ